MRPGHEQGSPLSAQAAIRLAPQVLPESAWERLAYQRYLRFLEREGLTGETRQGDCREESDESSWGRRLLGVIAGTVAAVIMIASLMTIFSGIEPESEQPSATMKNDAPLGTLTLHVTQDGPQFLTDESVIPTP